MLRFYLVLVVVSFNVIQYVLGDLPVKFPASADVSVGFPAKSESVKATEGPALVLKRIFLFLHPNFLVPCPAKHLSRHILVQIQLGEFQILYGHRWKRGACHRMHSSFHP